LPTWYHITLRLSAYPPKIPAVAANSPFAPKKAVAATLPATETAPNRRPNTTREIRQFPGSTTAADNSAQQYRGGAIPPCTVNRF